jgi:hypothetical protein
MSCFHCSIPKQKNGCHIEKWFIIFFTCHESFWSLVFRLLISCVVSYCKSEAISKQWSRWRLILWGRAVIVCVFVVAWRTLHTGLSVDLLLFQLLNHCSKRLISARHFSQRFVGYPMASISSQPHSWALKATQTPRH